MEPSEQGDASGGAPFGLPPALPPRRPGPLAALARNLRVGLALAAFRRVAPERVAASGEQVIWLALASTALGLGVEWIATEPPRAFHAEALAVQAAWLLGTLLLGWLAHREVALGDAGLSRILVMLLAPLPVGWIGFAALELGGRFSPAFADWIGGIYYADLFAIWVGLVYANVLRCYTGLSLVRVAALAVAFTLLWLEAFERLPSAYSWHLDEAAVADAPAPDAPGPDARDPEAEPAAPIDAEAVLHAQRERVAHAVAALAPERPGVVDLYFVGFAADATQGVFRREVERIRAVVERRLDARGRSIVLVNHADTLDALPLASASNLADALAGVAGVMDPDEDVLLLYLTGHGSRDHELQVRFPGLPLNAIDPPRLAAMVGDSGVAWTVAVVSACYSGGYVEPLRGERTLVLTSAAADRSSFGCSDASEMTYFGRAYFAEQLEATRDLVAAFHGARESVEARELAEEKEPSRPQLALGDAMAGKLAELEARLEARAAAEAPVAVD